MGQNADKVIAYNKGYVVLLARVVDIAFQTFIWRDYDITISAQCGLAMRQPNPPLWARVLSSVLNRLEPGHCELAILCDIDRAEQALRILTMKERP
jgi:hypothetical protein